MWRDTQCCLHKAGKRVNGRLLLLQLPLLYWLQDPFCLLTCCVWVSLCLLQIQNVCTPFPLECLVKCRISFGSTWFCAFQQSILPSAPLLPPPPTDYIGSLCVSCIFWHLTLIYSGAFVLKPLEVPILELQRISEDNPHRRYEVETHKPWLIKGVHNGSSNTQWKDWCATALSKVVNVSRKLSRHSSAAQLDFTYDHGYVSSSLTVENGTLIMKKKYAAFQT